VELQSLTAGQGMLTSSSSSPLPVADTQMRQRNSLLHVMGHGKTLAHHGVLTACLTVHVARYIGQRQGQMPTFIRFVHRSPSRRIGEPADQADAIKATRSPVANGELQRGIIRLTCVTLSEGDNIRSVPKTACSPQNRRGPLAEELAPQQPNAGVTRAGALPTGEIAIAN